MKLSILPHLLFALAWGVFFLLHSLTADVRVKARLTPLLGRSYRLAYNGFAVISLGAVWGIGGILLPEPRGLGLSDSVCIALYGLSAAGALGLIWAARGYDLARFSGTAQWRHRDQADFKEDEPLVIDGLHAHIRHPIYAFAFPTIWGLAQDERGLATAVWVSLYLIIGAKLEEQRLIALYGQAYRDYRRSVPAFLPRLMR